MLDPGTRIRHLHFFYSTPCLPPKFCITFVFYFSWVLHSSQEKLNFTRKTPRRLWNFSTAKCGSYLRAAFISLKAGRKTRTVLTMVLLRSNPALQTPHYHGQFALSLGKESPYILSKFNPLNTDTFSGPLKGPINGVWLDFRIRLTELTSMPRRLLTFLVPRGLCKGEA